MNPVCVKCQIELRPKHNGVLSVQMGTDGPVSVARCDLWHCPSCGVEILHGFGGTQHHNVQQEIEAAEADKRQKIVRYWANVAEKTDYEIFEAPLARSL